ncbi:MAG: DNA-processing protein DprA [Porphyromonadaceae bacterium]|nr:DNA-processing protein DprA [Porphyromonadaceae bacterium]
MNTKQIYQIALAQAKHVGPHYARTLLEVMGGVEAIFEDKARLRSKFPRLADKIVSELYRSDLMDEAKRIAEQCVRQGIYTLFVDESIYPERLRECADPPTLLYVRGKPQIWEQEFTLSVVGTRNISSYGQIMTDRLLTELSEIFPRMLIVSGLAYGVDIAAHKRAIQLGMPTIAVLAHGLDRIYPSVHTQIAHQMLEDGAWLSEYPPGTSPERYNFVGRNRIIAGLTEATFVVEAGVKSGSLITANLAAGYGREVLALPGRVTDPYSQGCNKLIADQLAVMASSGEQMVRAMGWERRGNVLEQQLQFATTAPPIQDDLYSLIAEKQPIHVNDLIRMSGLPASQVSTRLFDLELDGYISAMPGGVYIVAR